MQAYIETDCTVTFHGQTFESGGAVVTESHIVAYPAEGGVLKSWKGEILGTYRITSTWRTPRSFVSSTMHQIIAKVNGVYYTGRGGGVGMIFQGKRKAKQAW